MLISMPYSSYKNKRFFGGLNFYITKTAMLTTEKSFKKKNRLRYTKQKHEYSLTHV